MLIILSPAKDMLVESGNFTKQIETTKPCFLNESERIMAVLKQFTPLQLSEFMKISERLAITNHQRVQQWNKIEWERGAPAILSFKGEVYRGLKSNELQANDLNYAQKNLRILSGLYGVLRPLDLIQEYRLEMGTKISFLGYKNLYQFWGNLITKHIDEAIANSLGSKTLINLASEEYSSAISLNKLNHRTISPVFKQEVKGKLQIVAVYAKKARGLMARFAIDNKIENPEELKAFNTEGYFFDPNLSTTEKWLFIR